MRLGAIGRTMPVLLVMGGIAAPLGALGLFADGAAGPALGVSRPDASDIGPTLPDDAFRPAKADGCSVAQHGATALGRAPAATTRPYDLPVAEGATPASPHAALAFGATAPTPVILGPQLRVRADDTPMAAAVTISCGPAASPLKT